MTVPKRVRKCHPKSCHATLCQCLRCIHQHTCNKGWCAGSIRGNECVSKVES